MLLSVRVAWLALAVLAGPALTSTLEGTSTSVAVVAACLAAVGWGLGVVAVLVPRSVSLTALRVLAPLALAGAIACAVRASSVGVAEGAALAGCALVTGAVLLVGVVGDAFVDGSSYGPEKRFALRVPLLLLAGPVKVVWLAAVGPVIVAPLLLAAKAWAAGIVLIGVGVAVVRPALRSLHQLARRWLVFVPAGVVLHDPLALADPVLVPKRMVRSLRLAEVGDEQDAVDVTRNAPGLVIAIDATEAIPVGLVRGRRQAESIEASRLLLSPVRPGAVLAEARARSLG
ncbi:MAG: hypothetical protein ABIV94_11960 [Acidimicrobiales bacterium]